MWYLRTHLEKGLSSSHSFKKFLFGIFSVLATKERTINIIDKDPGAYLWEAWRLAERQRLQK